MIGPAVEATLRVHPTALGLIGGRRTVTSGAYRRAFIEKGVEVRQRIAQPLSALIESGDLNSGSLRNECSRILRPLRNCSHILLACTHYPAITGTLREHVSPQTQLIDPASAVVEQIWNWKLSGKGSDEFFTTGDANAMRRSAKAAFGVKISRPKQISVR
jgi:glutamate racemase